MTKIIQEIELQGQEQVKNEFNEIGKVGAKSFDQINAAAARLNVGAAKGVADNLRGIAPAAKGAAKGLGDLGDASDQATASMQASSRETVRFGSMLRLLGRAAGTRELSQMGRAVGVLGRIFKVAAPVLFAAGMAKVASSASTASEGIQDIAAETKTTNEEFQNMAAAATAVGVSTKEFGESLKAVDKMIEQTADNTRKLEEATRAYKNEMAAADSKSATITEGFEKVARQAAESARLIAQAEREMQEAFTATTRSIEDQIVALDRRKQDIAAGGKVSAETKRKREREDIQREEANIARQRREQTKKFIEDQEKVDRARAEAARKEREDTKRLMRELDDVERRRNEAREKLKQSREEVERNRTALDRLGITGVEVNGKLAKSPETLLKIADALKNTTDASKRQEIEFELVAAGLDRKLLPALRQGAEAYQKLQEAGKGIRPVITPEQTAVLDKFAIAADQVGSAMASIRDSAGAAIAPAIIPFLEQLRDILIDIRPGVTEFAQVLGSVLKPVLEGIGIVIKDIIVPAFKFLMEQLDRLAKAFNETFGTNITAMQIFVGIIFVLAAVFGGWLVAALAVVAAIGQIIKYMKETGVWDAFVENVKKAWNIFIKVWSGAYIKDLLAAIAGYFKDCWTTSLTYITDFVTNAKAKLSEWFGWLKGRIDEAIQWFKNLFGAQQQAQTGEGGAQPQGRARGGPVFGRGTGDTVPALLTPREYVMRTAATRKYGMGLFNALNSLRLPRNFLNALGDAGSSSMRGMMPVPLKMAAGGMVPTRSPMKSFDLFLNGEAFPGLQAPEDTAKNLQRAAITRQIRSAGRKPGFYGGGR